MFSLQLTNDIPCISQNDMSPLHNSELVDVVGINASNRGRSCEAHATCGNVIQLDMILHLRVVQILNDSNKEETAIAAYWVTDGIDRCRVGFLPRYAIKHSSRYNGRIGQVVELLMESESPAERKKSHQNLGVCRIVLIGNGLNDRDGNTGNDDTATVEEGKEAERNNTEE